MDGRIVRCGIISSCRSAATCPEIVKALLPTSQSHVRSAIASTVGLLYFYYLLACNESTFTVFMGVLNRDQLRNDDSVGLSSYTKR